MRLAAGLTVFVKRLLARDVALCGYELGLIRTLSFVWVPVSGAGLAMPLGLWLVARRWR